ncbi:MAG: hypothetical protein RL708_374 [Bacteroidota bacterium]
MKKIFFCVLLFSFSMLAKAQSDSTWKFKKLNSVNIELLGPAILYSVNYERIILNAKRFKTIGNIGVSYFPYSKLDKGASFQTPIYLAELFSISKKKYVELGVGNKFMFAKNELYNIPFFRIGIRHQNPDGKFYFKIAIIPTVERGELAIMTPDGKPAYVYSYFPWVGFTFGYAF